MHYINMTKYIFIKKKIKYKSHKNESHACFNSSQWGCSWICKQRSVMRVEGQSDRRTRWLAGARRFVMSGWLVFQTQDSLDFDFTVVLLEFNTNASLYDLVCVKLKDMEAFTIKSRIKSLLRSPSIISLRKRSRDRDSPSRKVKKPLRTVYHHHYYHY